MVGAKNRIEIRNSPRVNGLDDQALGEFFFVHIRGVREITVSTWWGECIMALALSILGFLV